MGITTEFGGFIPKSLVLNSIVLGWIIGPLGHAIVVGGISIMLIRSNMVDIF